MAISSGLGGYTPPGLVLVGKATATSGSTLSVSSCLTADYTNYLVTIDNAVANATCGVHLALLNGASLNAANWTWGQSRPDYAANTFGYNKASSDSQGPQVCVATTTNPTSAKVELFRPQKTSWTTVLASGMDARGTGGYVPLTVAGQLENNTQYDGIRVEFSATTIASLTIRVYGYRD